MSVHSRCAGCPLAADDCVPCHAVTSGHARFCELVAEGRPGYAELVANLSRGAHPPASPPVAAAGPAPKVTAESRLVVRGICDSSTGYGQTTARLGEALEAAGIPVAFDPINLVEHYRPVDPFVRGRLLDGPHAGPALVMYGPGTAVGGDSVLLTMWEATGLAPHVVASLNRARAVVVPCDDNARWFRASGVTAPLRVVPLGIDPAIHHPGPRPSDGLVRFGAAGRVGAQGDRKRLGSVASLFVAALGDREDAVLEIKCWADCRVIDQRHPRVRFVRDALTDEGLADWYRALDVFVSASKGEGWGLQPHQAMACGVPTVAPFWGGHAHYMTPGTSWEVEHDEKPAGFPYRAAGVDARWCWTRRDSMIARLREAYEDGAARAAKAAAAAARAAEFTWERSGRELAAVVREFGLDPTPSPPPPNPMAVYRAVLKCEHRVKPACGCPSASATCKLGRGKAGEVSMDFCRRCIEAGGP